MFLAVFIHYCPLALDPVRAPLQPARQGEAAEMVPSLPAQGEEKDTEGIGLHYPLQEKQNVQLSGVQRPESCLQEVKCDPGSV